MAPIRSLHIAKQIAPEDQALARELSLSPVTGDPSTDSLSSVEIERAWREVDRLDPAMLPSLVRLSKQLGVAVPEPHEPSARVEKLLGPVRVDAKTGQVVRRTRIVATVGPSSSSPGVLAKMITAGLDVARINFSHIGSFEQAKALVDALHAAEAKAGRKIRILADLQGPKLRIGALEAPVALKEGETIDLVAALGPSAGASRPALPIAPPAVLADLKAGDRIFVDDGKVEIKVTSKVDGAHLEAEVITGGKVSSRKGLNLPDTKVSERVPTDKDREDLETIKKLGIDLVAVSFVEDASDLARVRALLPGAQLIAKIERPKALENIEAIYAEADGIMVARGDAAVEMGDAEMPAIQKRLHELGNKTGVPTGTATQMMESMLTSARPSRADASDVARSVFESSDFVMTSAETAVGPDPVAILKMMAKIIETTEKAIRTGTHR